MAYAIDMVCVGNAVAMRWLWHMDLCGRIRFAMRLAMRFDGLLLLFLLPLLFQKKEAAQKNIGASYMSVLLRRLVRYRLQLPRSS